jgi:hypothetical protein
MRINAAAALGVIGAAKRHAQLPRRQLLLLRYLGWAAPRHVLQH